MAAPEAASTSSEGDDATGPASLDQLLRRAAEARARRRRAKSDAIERNGSASNDDAETGRSGTGLPAR